MTPTDPLPPEVHDAYAFVETMVPQAGLYVNGAPLWFGWVLREAYLAGVAAERERAAVRAQKAVEHNYGYSGAVVADAVRRPPTDVAGDSG